ncbi:MAG: serine hydrolase [Mobilicoccus sp.]|nr:serine hydrolase [Mobilicoccus sp.]
MARRVRGVVAILAALSLVGVPVTAVAGPQPAAATESRADDDGAVFPLSDAAVREALGAGREDVSFSVRDRRTGAVYTYNPDMRNATASVVKVLVLATVIRERRDTGRDLTSGQKHLAELMIRSSDNDATSTLFNRVGRDAVARMAADLGMTRTEVSWSWGKTSTSAADQRLLMDRLVDGTEHLGAADRRYILGLMAEVDPQQRWGVGDVPAESGVSVKNGWVPLSPGGWRVNSIGSVKAAGRDYTLSILSTGTETMDAGTERARIVSELVWETLDPMTGRVGAAAQDAPGGPVANLPRWISRGAAFPPRPWG